MPKINPYHRRTLLLEAQEKVKKPTNRYSLQRMVRDGLTQETLDICTRSIQKLHAMTVQLPQLRPNLFRIFNSDRCYHNSATKDINQFDYDLTFIRNHYYHQVFETQKKIQAIRAELRNCPITAYWSERISTLQKAQERTVLLLRSDILPAFRKISDQYQRFHREINNSIEAIKNGRGGPMEIARIKKFFEELSQEALRLNLIGPYIP